MLDAVLLLIAGIVVILIIIAINGYFVAQEFAYMSVDRNRLTAEALAGDEAADRALEVTKRTSFMLSGAQLGITVTGLLVGYVAEPMVGKSIGTLLGGAGVPAEVSILIGTVGVLVFATVIQMLFGELYPKNLAIANAGPVARWMARSTIAYLKVFGWLIAFFDTCANLLLRLVRIEPIHDLDRTATADDLERIVADSRESGDLPLELSVLLDRILDFPDQDAEHAMLPRSRVDVVPSDMQLADVRELMAHAHTRYPVVDDDGQPIGVVQLSDVLRIPAETDASVREIMQPPVIVPTSMPLPAVLAELDEAGARLACVVNEHGDFAGIVTTEDLAEELVGEITDEHDPDPVDLILPLEDNLWLMDGGVHVDELERTIGLELPQGDFETLAGLLLEEVGDLLEAGQFVSVHLPQDPAELVSDTPVLHALEVEVLEIARHVPSQLEVRLVELAPEGESIPEEDEPADVIS